VALTVPAYTAADLVRRDCPDASMALKSLDYPPVAAVTVSYPMSAIKQDRLDEARKLPGKAKLLCCYIKALLTESLVIIVMHVFITLIQVCYDDACVWTSKCSLQVGRF